MEKITYIKIDDTDREGNALVGKNGRPYSRQTLKVVSKEGRFISGFLNESTKGFKVGDEVDIVIMESDKLDKNGNPYLNWSLVKKEDKTDAKLEQILNKLTGISLDLLRIESKLEGKKSTYPANDAPEPFPDNEFDDSSPF